MRQIPLSTNLIPSWSKTRTVWPRGHSRNVERPRSSIPAIGNGVGSPAAIGADFGFALLGMAATRTGKRDRRCTTHDFQRPDERTRQSERESRAHAQTGDSVGIAHRVRRLRRTVFAIVGTGRLRFPTVRALVVVPAVSMKTAGNRSPPQRPDLVLILQLDGEWRCASSPPVDSSSSRSGEPSSLRPLPSMERCMCSASPGSGSGSVPSERS